LQRENCARRIRPGAVHDHHPLSLPKFAVELKALGYDKWKSCGRIRYRGLQFVA
jgi:hypothetical protein